MHEREAARQNALGDSDASALALERDLGPAEPDRAPSAWRQEVTGKEDDR